MSARQVRAQYTQEYKLEAVRQVKAGQSVAVVAKVRMATQNPPPVATSNSST